MKVLLLSGLVHERDLCLDQVFYCVLVGLTGVLLVSQHRHQLSDLFDESKSDLVLNVLKFSFHLGLEHGFYVCDQSGLTFFCGIGVRLNDRGLLLGMCLLVGILSL